MQIVEVISKDDKREFLNLPKRLYRDEPFWVCQLDSGIESIFNPSENHTFKHGEAIRWILKDNSGLTIGRISAFIDNVRSAANHQRTGGCGFFEVIEDRDAAFLLFDTARTWLAERGMQAMDGPINFGENDNNWGLLVEGFMPQAYGMPYNKIYYKSFFEDYGFQNYFEQYSYHREVRGSDKRITMFPERIMRIAEWLSKRPAYSFRHFEISRSSKYVNDIVEIYNSTWSVFKEDFSPLDPAFLYESLKKARPVIDEDLIWFAYYNDKPISFFICLPDVNQIFRHFNGKMNPWNMARFLWFRTTHEMTRLRAVAGGVNPSHQNSGVESAIFLHIYKTLENKPWYTEMELSWVGDFNSKMIAIYEALGAKKAKTHVTYRYIIDKNVKFKRYKDEMAERQSFRR